MDTSNLKWRGLGLEDKITRAVLLATEGYVNEAIQAIKGGKVIAVPTDTLYGFACDACSAEAVHQIYEIKGRKQTSPLAICVGDVKDIERFAVTDHLPSDLLDSLLPGPVTVVLMRGRAGSTVVDLTRQGYYKILRPGSAMEETVAILQRHSLREDER
ncbi:yrdC domain-containing protein, mitochondrial-like isoform X3 [Papaver somniferum]|uniref:yrdC domain-containing protein, mitochondrial-like isoform X3 n=1 Tax=Papaver somniferum TaxID=3469 RepID=UPI000E701644|nr:yrdC domain-containing protein, mitochondrial-like isoform X3 [Papaver somniferum]